jgi:hypothetical protein
MKIKPNDYLIAEVQGRATEEEASKAPKRYFLKAYKVVDDEVYGFLEDPTPHLKREKITVTKDQVILNLGPTPAKGSVYGFDVSDLYLGAKQHDSFGDVHFFVKPPKEQRAKMSESMDRIARRLRKIGLENLLNLPIAFEVRNKRGKYAGMFHMSKDADKKPHRIELFPDADVPSYDYLLAHELGHPLHMVVLKDHRKLNADWIRLYNQSIRPRVIERERVIQLRKALAAQEEAPGSWGRALVAEEGDEAKAELKLIFRWISQVHSLTVQELDQLWDEGDGKNDVVELWPTTELKSKDIKPLVSEYSTVSPKELFAEAMAYDLTGRELPKQVKKLLERSYALARIELKKA